jgi:hypothetical protein
MPFIEPGQNSVEFVIGCAGPRDSGRNMVIRCVFSKTAPERRGPLQSGASLLEELLSFTFTMRTLPEVAGLKPIFRLIKVPGDGLSGTARLRMAPDLDGVVFVADARAERIEANIEALYALARSFESVGRSLDEVPLAMMFNKADLATDAGLSERKAVLNPKAIPSWDAVAPMGAGVFEPLTHVIRGMTERFADGAQRG